jgi:flagellar basal-body rod protein FlgC
VRVTKIELDRSPFRKVYDPTNPDADGEGNVLYPNIDLAVEVVNAMEASRAYEANVTAMEVTKAMINASLRLLV